MAQRLDMPARKIFVKMLGEEDVTVNIQPNDLVWVEGIIREVRDEESIFIMDDNTSRTKVDYSNPKKLRSHNADMIAVNSCVMVIGSIESYPPNPLIKAVRIAPIANSDVGFAMWELEVEDMNREVYRARYLRRLREEGDPMAHYPLGY